MKMLNVRLDHGYGGSDRKRFVRTALSLAASWACWSAPAWAEEVLWPTSVLAPAGYSAAINTPTADVLPWGGGGFGWSNSNPERARKIGAGGFGSLDAGVGLLPGLELVGRLAYEGDLHCNTYDPACHGGQRDLSVSGKYQLPIELPLDTRLAVGFTDYGGATSGYRQVYGVATSTWGPLDLSLGYSRPRSNQALMDGAFGGVVLRVDEHWSAALEHDTREARVGVQYRRPLAEDLALQLGASRKLSDQTGQQAWQMTAALNWMLGRVPEPAKPSRATERAPALLEVAGAPAAAATVQAEAVPADVMPAAAEARTTPTSAASPAPTPEALAQALQSSGFAQVNVRHWPAADGQPALWQVQAEPRRWRKSQLDALGMALAAWLKTFGDGSAVATDELLLSLTYQRQPVLHAYSSARCLAGWVQGWTRCALVPQADGALGRALLLSRDGDWPEPVQAQLQARRTALAGQSVQDAVAEGGPAWLPQFEIGPSLRTAVGTEYGLLDYSLALDLGVEVNLAPGLFWQGVASTPLAHSDDYGDRRVFADNRHPEAGWDSSMLSYWRNLPLGLAAQASAGQLTRTETGGQIDALWMNEDGRWRLSATMGRYESDQDRRIREPLLGGLRYSAVPGAWQLEVTAGRFMGGDEGYRLASRHWFGDTRFTLYYRDSASPGRILMPERKFLGFEFSLPLGPKATQELGPLSVRGRDRWGWGLETKVGESDNYLTRGYGVMPGIRHGLTSDVSDFDRNGRDDLLANSARLRTLLVQQLAARP